METVYIPSVWTDDVKKHPSKISAASINDNGEYFYEEKYYDVDMNEIAKEEYEKLLEAYEKSKREREECIRNFETYGKDKLFELGWNPTGYVYKYADVEEYRLDNCDTRLFIGIEKDKRMNILSPGKKYLITYGYVDYDGLEELTKILRNIEDIKNNPDEHTLKELNEASATKKDFLKRNRDKSYEK